MNKDIFRYKLRFITVALLFSYAFMHVQLTGVYEDVSFDKLINFSVRFPYAQRLLVPTVVHFLIQFLPFRIDELFFLMEWLFISLFYFALFRLLQEEFEVRQAQLLSWLFILLLPLVTVINYRFSTDGEATFFYPSDSAALFFMALGFLLCLRAQWVYFIPCVFLATFNRETSILLVLLVPALHWQRLDFVFKPMLLAMLAYFLARFLVLTFLQGIPGQLMEWYFHTPTLSHFTANLLWLLNKQHIFLFIYCFAGLPLFWFAFYDYIPLQYKSLRYVALFYFLILLLVGNFIEARLFTEILVLLYMPVCISISRWLANVKPNYSPKRAILYYIDRYAVLTILLCIVIFRTSLDKWVIGLSHLLR